jgi:hypothetical protein
MTLCDKLRNHASRLSMIRDAVFPSRNGLSNANNMDWTNHRRPKA